MEPSNWSVQPMARLMDSFPRVVRLSTWGFQGLVKMRIDRCKGMSMPRAMRHDWARGFCKECKSTCVEFTTRQMLIRSNYFLSCSKFLAVFERPMFFDYPHFVCVHFLFGSAQAGSIKKKGRAFRRTCPPHLNSEKGRALKRPIERRQWSINRRKLQFCCGCCFSS